MRTPSTSGKRERGHRDDGAFLDATIAAWQPYAPHELTSEDAREIAHNVTGLFGLLLQLKKARIARDGGDSGITLVAEESP